MEDIEGILEEGEVFIWPICCRGADLSGANLSWTDFSGADLRGADLSGAFITVGNVIRNIAE